MSESQSLPPNTVLTAQPETESKCFWEMEQQQYLNSEDFQEEGMQGVGLLHPSFFLKFVIIKVLYEYEVFPLNCFQ
jgi:hypothetical protein